MTLCPLSGLCCFIVSNNPPPFQPVHPHHCTPLGFCCCSDRSVVTGATTPWVFPRLVESPVQKVNDILCTHSAGVEELFKDGDKEKALRKRPSGCLLPRPQFLFYLPPVISS